ncbi:unnamed protein product [Rhizophagus irregularis]|uniref:Uncharacterized protein n=1 Tax=Rhizophagus irregularis TaxID=588596 RepID=A0A916E139_9GLOM|nr:unnamed protein product [Rhizophagus irregularis]
MNPSQLEEFENETATLNDKNEMSPQFSSIQDNVDNVTLSNSKILNELHKEKMRQTNKISSKNDTKFNNDMAESVPGLYRLLDLCKDDGSNGLVDKIIIYKEGLKNLCLVIHWPEYGCYEDNTSSQRKKNMINLHRYLTKLTDYQICLMNEQDLNSFDWKRDEEEVLNDNDGVCYEFEVKKSQEEREDFEIFNGFNVILPNIITSEINQSYNGILLHPKVIESVSYQTFFTQKIIAPSTVMIKGTTSIAKSHFNKEFMDRWGNCSVRIDRSTINIKMLEILVKYELNIDDLKEQLNQYNEALGDAKKESDNKKAQERDEDINDNGEENKNEKANKNKDANDNENANDNEKKSNINEDGEENKNEESNKNKDASDNENANDNEEKSEVNEDERANKAKLFSKYSDLKDKLSQKLKINTPK